MKKLIAATFACAAFAVCAGEVPKVSNITMTQSSGSRLVTITYNLAGAAAVVTLDIQTNVTDGVWASIGGENIQHVSGDVWKRVETGDRTITWRPDLSWPDHEIDNGNARAVVTAWSVDNPPDYLVVDLSATGGIGTERYYPTVEFLPGGLLRNPIYRTSSLVMRKIPAKGVTWSMGCGTTEIGRTTSDTREAAHNVTLTNNYYIAVFETTQEQWAFIKTDHPTPAKFSKERSMRPVEYVSYNEIRNSTNTKANTTYDYPTDPNPGSFLGLLRTKTGLLFDLPSEAQWEFACRAGHGTGYWGDGSPIEDSGNDANLATLCRFMYNGGQIPDSTGKKYSDPAESCDVTNGTAVVGSYAPNSWGLYDMYGNVWEWCLDLYATDITKMGGVVNTTSGSKRVVRGGGWGCGAYMCRASYRIDNSPSDSYNSFGFRLALPACPAGLSKQ